MDRAIVTPGLTGTGGVMSSARSRASSRGAGGYDLVVFAWVLLLMLGVFNLIDGIAAVANSHVFTSNAHYVFGDLKTWGWIVLIIGALQVLAGLGIMTGNQLARWLGVALIGLDAVAQMMFLPAYPIWALLIIAGDVAALYGLCAYGGRQEAAAY
jgi:hypothetical protein